MEGTHPKPRLAWHETLELHELVAFQSGGLMRLKKSYPKVMDGELKKIYMVFIQGLTANLKELMAFYPVAPRVADRNPEPDTDISMKRGDETGYYAGQILGWAKSAVRNYAVALTETTTPILHQVLLKQMVSAVQMHYMVFSFMYRRGMYPAHDLHQLLAGDLMRAKTALSMKY
ncbi:spore coat protein [Kroppenstedtia eburnea]|uniref:Spore coat protein F n=1 Tax=Kroppenstedtia eburnea TaxID=714067 RepID=A0A1N7Q0R0_9BACL|nr:spore coat protein [Kroppenstedtia eburnea]QKI81081.1 spore coat protein [Kroppenstedtia eburnea]SIT16269.1 spore coat protein F [Kroppenstedtia eburnea]